MRLAFWRHPPPRTDGKAALAHAKRQLRRVEAIHDATADAAGAIHDRITENHLTEAIRAWIEQNATRNT